jgi:predicted molibdopterin-dependent oxidoreductase YjgC
VFGAGGGTSSYREIEETDVILLWGSNARETHPIFFHHLLKGVRGGARLFVVDPRRTSSAQWADAWLGLDVGSDIALSNTMAREIIRAGLENRAFIENATVGFDEYAESVEPYTLEEGERLTGVPAATIREVAHAFARADRAMICWTLGITEHHNAVDNVLSLINLGLLCGHVGRYGSGLNPLRGQNNVQGGGDMGAIPNKLPGFQDIERDDEAMARFEAAWGTPIDPHYGWHLTQMFHGMERGELRTLYVIGENPAQSEADVHHARHLLEGLDFLIVQDIIMTKTAELADVVFPSSASWCESDGTVTNSERRVQLVRKALDPPGEARDDMWILAELARRLGYDWGSTTAEDAWNELRSLSPMHRGMSYARLEELGGIQWPCPEDGHPGSPFLHARLWQEPREGPPAPFSVVEHRPPFEALDADYPIRLTTGRRLESYNTGVQTNLYRSPLHRGEAIELSPEDAERLLVEDGEVVKVSSRRGAVEVPVRIDTSLRPGLAFMTLHTPDEVDTNVLTIDATDPKSGTAEFKAAAIRVEKVDAGEVVGKERDEVHAGALASGS